jgi:agmatinase
MPATGTPEPGGLDYYGVLDIFKAVAREKNIVGFDFVELAPIKGLNHPDFTTAKLIYKLMGYIASRKVR